MGTYPVKQQISAVDYNEVGNFQQLLNFRPRIPANHFDAYVLGEFGELRGIRESGQYPHLVTPIFGQFASADLVDE